MNNPFGSPALWGHRSQETHPDDRPTLGGPGPCYFTSPNRHRALSGPVPRENYFPPRFQLSRLNMQSRRRYVPTSRPTNRWSVGQSAEVEASFGTVSALHCNGILLTHLYSKNTMCLLACNNRRGMPPYCYLIVVHNSCVEQCCLRKYYVTVLEGLCQYIAHIL